MSRRLIRATYQQKTVNTLLVLAGSFFTLSLITYVSAFFVLPSLSSYWGAVLFTLLSVWVATSTWMLLIHTKQHTQLLVVIGLVAAIIAGGTMKTSGLSGLLLVILAGLVLLSLTLLLVLLHLRGQHPRVQVLLFGFAPMLTGVIMLATANLIRLAPPALPTNTITVSDELRYLSHTDQHDRETSFILFNSNRDQARLQRVIIIDKQKLINTPEAQYHAALILQHGTCPDHFRRAYELSSGASSKISNAEWLARASYDRWMLSIGKPQKYNTQLFLRQSTCKTLQQ
ncbi:MAG: hypothetical protein KME29_20885 [Calothrix sp. FI2-JRJ7]|jgi:hypothetical protein|nr:hypothetical protein [Calothrix sp. FI2-JRJ7]